MRAPGRDSALQPGVALFPSPGRLLFLPSHLQRIVQPVQALRLINISLSLHQIRSEVEMSYF